MISTPYQLDVAWQASAFVITYPVNNKVETTGEENGKAVAWERAFINLVKVGHANSVSLVGACSQQAALPLIEVYSI